MRQKTLNPFDPRRPAEELMFVGRQSYLMDLLRGLKQGDSYGLIGKAGIGKTSLLWAVRRELLKNATIEAPVVLVPIYLEFTRTWKQEADIFNVILTEFVKGIESQTGFNYSDRQSSVWVNQDHNFSVVFNEILDWYFAQSHKTCKLVLLLDDLHRGISCHWLAEAMLTLRPVVSGGWIQVVLSGELPLDAEFRNDVSPLRNLVSRQITLKQFSIEEVRDLLVIAQSLGLGIEKSCEDLVYKLTEGYPYIVHYYLRAALTKHGNVSCDNIEEIHREEGENARRFLRRPEQGRVEPVGGQIFIERVEQHIGAQTNIAGGVDGSVASGQFQSATSFGGGQAADARGETKRDISP